MDVILELYQSDGRPCVSKTASEWAGPCPNCGGTDRFILLPGEGKDGLGRWFCRQCSPKGGDAIEYLRRFRGMSFPEAKAFLGLPGDNGNPYNNYSTQGNYNPYTGQQGYVQPQPLKLPPLTPYKPPKFGR